MIPVSLTDIAAAVEGQLLGSDAVITSVSTDTRQIAAGDLFIALAGARFDAHDMLPQAVAAGASAVIVERRCELPVAQIVVENTRKALGELGALVKQRVAPKTVAITGSAGKTTVKEMVAAILAQKGQVLATLGNFNNDIGVPLTLLRLTQDHQYAVVELGANHRGEIAYTSSLVKPDAALITNASAAHLEGFGDLFGVARAKGEIFLGLQPQGIAILNADSQFSEFWRNSVGQLQRLEFSLCHAEADLSASQIALDPLGYASFTLHLAGEQQRVTLSLPGQHNVANALAAAAAAHALGCSLAEIGHGLGTTPQVKGRLNMLTLPDGHRLIDDSYNASVASVRAAIDLLADLPQRRILVLGDMAELGSEARSYHQQLGQYARQRQLDAVVTVGTHSQATAGAALEAGIHLGSQRAVVDWLLNELQRSALPVTVLVKGSRSAKMENIVEMLVAAYAPTTEGEQ